MTRLLGQKAVVLAAGHIADYAAVRPFVGDADLVVCADAGVRHAGALGLQAHVVVGDFDSLGTEGLRALGQTGVEVITLPTDKDYTDTHLALLEAIDRGAREVVLAGVTGDRLDHTLANLLLLTAVPAGVGATVVDAKNVIYLVTDGAERVLYGEIGSFVSLVPLSPAVTGINTEGLRWPLADGRLAWGESRGVSNEFLLPRASVRVGVGHLLVILSRD